ncbi:MULTISPECIES: hypothetical protein [unclassified Pseudomonas]|uniref:hypothetical protein n=1 Tax=unclassified Pseudomonas TaxID=196821 RepID=UPI00257C6D51|nr:MULTISPECIES: hypothetical protein [unclassified Pseudomonas]
MSTDIDRSFIATLQHDGSPINVFDTMTTGPVILASPYQAPAFTLDGTRTLGLLNGNEDDWQHGREMGLVSFDKGPAPDPLMLYFRYSHAGYRLYVRSGRHLGEGVFCSAYGVVNSQPIEALDPASWHVTLGQNGEPFDLTETEGDSHDIQLTNLHGHPLQVHGLYPVGGYLTCYPAARKSTLRLIILARNIDWLNAD